MARPATTPRRAPTTTLPTPAGVRKALRPGQLRPGDRVDRFEVLGELGSGASGIVYKVRHTSLGTHHALKVLAWAHPQLQARLLSEGRAQSRLSHPNVVAVTDLLEVDGLPALLMEVVDGPSLEAWLQHTRPEPDQAEALFRGILAGVAAAHALGIVHRDLKPANVMMARVDGRWVPKVTDFGLAKWTDSDLGLTRTGMTMGTPGYMAPEQIRSSRDVDHRADLFALGCIYYELLTGEPPHGGEDPLTVMNAVAEGRVKPITALRHHLPPRVIRTVRAAMARDADDRPQTCAELEQCLDGVRTPGRRWARPRLHPSVRTASLAGAVALASALVIAAAWSLPGPQPVQIVERAPPPTFVEAAPSTPFGETQPHDDVDATMMPPPPTSLDADTGAPVDGEAEPRPDTEAAPEGTPACAGFLRGEAVWLPLPRVWWMPRDGVWQPRREISLHRAPVDEASAVACTIGEGSAIVIPGEPVRADGRRWLRITLEDLRSID